MPQMNSSEALILGIVILLALLIAWWIMRRPAGRVRTETVDVLTPGAAPATRNTLLVDAPPVVAPPGAELLGGIGEIISAAATSSATSLDDADNLTRIKGLGPKIATLLRSLGVTRFDQIAAWSEADVARIDSQLGTFQGRIARDNWIEQARYLSAGDVSGFEAKFGKV